MLNKSNLDIHNQNHIYDNLANKYDNHYNLAIHKIEDNFIRNELSEGNYLKGILLDIGCGTGYLLDNFIISDWKYTGIDISKEMIINAKLKHKDYNFKIMDIEDFRINGMFNNVISLFGCLSYVNYQSIAIENIRKSLDRNGKFFIMFYGKNYKSRKSYILNKNGIDPKLNLLSDDEILDLFKDFKEVKITNISSKLSEFLSNILPYELARIYFDFERKYLSRLFRNHFYFKIVTGKK